MESQGPLKSSRIEDDEAEIKEFFHLLDRLRAMAKTTVPNLRSFSSAQDISTAARNKSPWKLAFEWEDFSTSAKVLDGNDYRSKQKYSSSASDANQSKPQETRKLGTLRDTQSMNKYGFVETFDLNVEPSI